MLPPDAFMLQTLGVSHCLMIMIDSFGSEGFGVLVALRFSKTGQHRATGVSGFRFAGLGAFVLDQNRATSGF